MGLVLETLEILILTSAESSFRFCKAEPVKGQSENTGMTELRQLSGFWCGQRARGVQVLLKILDVQNKK